MNTKLLIVILSALLLTIAGCDVSKIPTSSRDLEFPKQLTASGKDMIPFISPDGEHIAFLSLRNTFDTTVAAVAFELWITDKNGSGQHPIFSIDELNNGLINATDVSWSVNSFDMLIRVYSPAGSGIWKVSVDGTKTRLSSTEYWAGRPQYSPDGTRISYIVQGPNTPQGSPVYRLYVCNADFSDPFLIETGLIEDYEWNGNSDEIIYSLYDRPNENFDLWKSSVSGNDKKQFSNTPVSELYPSFSHDGKNIAYNVRDTVYVTPSHNFLSQKIIEHAYHPMWIPNKNLLLISSEQTLDNERFWTEPWIIDLEGNVIIKIADGKATAVSFSSNGEHYVYALEGNLWIDQL